MNTHVNGHFTPMTIGELRQSILAVYVGNPLFSDAEQLEANHDAHESEDVYFLVAWLKGARLEDSKRGHIARLRAARAIAKPIVLEEAAQDAELVDLLTCPALDQSRKVALAHLAALSCLRPSGRLRLLGDTYMHLLGAAGSIEPYCGIEGLYEN